MLRNFIIPIIESVSPRNVTIFLSFLLLGLPHSQILFDDYIQHRRRVHKNYYGKKANHCHCIYNCTCTIIIIHTCIRMYLPNTDSIFTSFTAMMASAILQYQYYYYEEFITCSVLFTFSLLLSLSCVDRPFDEGFLKYETFCKCCQVPV